MERLELIVTEEQIKGFLKDEFKDFTDDLDSPRNYIGFASEAQKSALFWKSLKGLPKAAEQYLQDVVISTFYFLNSAQDLVSSDPQINREEAITSHYQSIISLAEVYNKGLQLNIGEDKNVTILKEEIDKIMGYLEKQIFVINTLFDPTKREGVFREKIRGTGFAKYVEEIASNN